MLEQAQLRSGPSEPVQIAAAAAASWAIKCTFITKVDAAAAQHHHECIFEHLSPSSEPDQEEKAIGSTSNQKAEDVEECVSQSSCQDFRRRKTLSACLWFDFNLFNF